MKLIIKDRLRRDLNNKYVIPLTKSRTISLPQELILNNVALEYTGRRCVKLYKVCYSNLWIYPITIKDKLHFENITNKIYESY